MSEVAIIVPCRLESTRFPRKLLHVIDGKPLILWVAERIAAEAPEFPLYFAVDDELLRQPLAQRGFRTIMTGTAHVSGTDRLAEANRTVGAERVLNVQADEPTVTGDQIRMLAGMVGTGGAPMATLATPFATAADFQSPNQVKVVTRADGRALYFSRSPIPFPRDAAVVDDAWVRANRPLRHIGLYAYRAPLLEGFARLPPGGSETREKLEQLRVLENGYEIQVGLTAEQGIGVDVPGDAEKFREWLKCRPSR